MICDASREALFHGRRATALLPLPLATRERAARLGSLKMPPLTGHIYGPSVSRQVDARQPNFR